MSENGGEWKHDEPIEQVDPELWEQMREAAEQLDDENGNSK